MIPESEKGVCYICGRMGHTDLHHIFEGATRKQSDKDGLTVWLCRECHSLVHSSKGKDARDFLHEVGQRFYEENHTREEFIKNYIKSYL